ncbi:MAG: hypothetical protein JWO45_777, partial [Spartobacteria bacterium]|nr:hypothetical protein [Spartobacteria bacterium]
STAKENARLNKIDMVRFRVGDVRHFLAAGDVDIVVANLFSELLIDILPKLKRVRWLILSGVLRKQERELVSALRRHAMSIVKTRRRGKWIALLARSHSTAESGKNDRGAGR